MTTSAFDEHIGIIKAIKGLQLLCKAAGQFVKIAIHIYSTKAVIAQGNNAWSLFKTAQQDISMTHQSKLFNMPAEARPIRTIFQYQSKVHCCATLLHF